MIRETDLSGHENDCLCRCCDIHPDQCLNFTGQEMTIESFERDTRAVAKTFVRELSFYEELFESSHHDEYMIDEDRGTFTIRCEDLIFCIRARLERCTYPLEYPHVLPIQTMTSVFDTPRTNRCSCCDIEIQMCPCFTGDRNKENAERDAISNTRLCCSC